MTCRKVQAELSAFLDGELPRESMDATRLHLEQCPVCAQEAHEIATIKKLIGEKRDLLPPDDFEERLMAHVFAADRQPVRQWRVNLGIAAVAMAAALLAVLVANKMNTTGPQLKDSDPVYASDLGHDQMYYNATDPLSGPAPMVTASYGQ